MRQRERERHTLHGDEFGRGELSFVLAVAGFFEDLIQSAQLLRFFQEQADGLLQVLDRLFLSAGAGGNIELKRVSYRRCAAL